MRTKIQKRENCRTMSLMNINRKILNKKLGNQTKSNSTLKGIYGAAS